MCKDHGFKLEPGVNVADDLGHILELRLDQCQFLLFIDGLVNGRSHDHTFVECRGSLRNGHGVVPVQHTMGEDALVVECMSQFVSQGDNIRKHAVEVGENPAFFQTVDFRAESTAGFTVSGIEVNPFFLKGSCHHIRQFFIKAGKLLYQIVMGILGSEFGGGFAHGRKEVIPGQAVFVSQRLGFCFQILPEFGQIFVHSLQHGIQSFFLHVGVFQRPCQSGFITAKLTVGNRFQFDGVQRKGDRILDPVIAGKFCFIGIFSDRSVRIIGKIPDRRQIDGTAPVAYRHSAGKIGLQITPGVAAGKLHPGHDFFPSAAQQIPAGILHFGEQEPVLTKNIVLLDQFHEIRKSGRPFMESSFRCSHGAADTHQPSQLGYCFCISGVSGLTQRTVQPQFSDKAADFLLQSNAVFQPVQRPENCQLFSKRSIVCDFGFAGFQILLKPGIIKTCINGA